MTADFASSVVGLGLALIVIGLTFLFNVWVAAVVLGVILLLAGVSAHLNGRETAAATDGDVADAA